MRKSSKRVLLDYLNTREEHYLRNKISKILLENIGLCQSENWNHRLAQIITKTIKRNYLFIRKTF